MLTAMKHEILDLSLSVVLTLLNAKGISDRLCEGYVLGMYSCRGKYLQSKTPT